MKTQTLCFVLFLTLVSACTTPANRFETLMVQSREGRDQEALATIAAILADQDEPPLVRARTEMTAALIHIRSKNWNAARAALDRARSLGIEQDTGYFKDHLAEYDSWIKQQD